MNTRTTDQPTKPKTYRLTEAELKSITAAAKKMGLRAPRALGVLAREYLGRGKGVRDKG